MAKGRHLTDEEKKAISKRMKRMWRRKRREKAKVLAGNFNGQSTIVEKVEKELTSQKLRVRLIAYGNNPNTGAIELHTHERMESMRDGLQGIIDLLYSGIPMTEIRLEELD